MVKHSLKLAEIGQAYWLVVGQQKLWLPDGHVPFGAWDALGLNAPQELLQIGQWQDKPCILAIYQDQLTQPEHWLSARHLLDGDTHWFELAARATQLALFMQTHQYCGQCGDKMQLVSWELAMLCRCCGHRVYPRISPCVLVAVYRDDEILLARSNRHKPGYFSILAGFVESGETLEQAAVREVAEEVGVRIHQLEYAGSQPWPFPHSLMMGFYARYAGGDIRCQEHEIEEAAWYKLTALPQVPPVESLSGRMIAQLRQRAEKTTAD